MHFLSRVVYHFFNIIFRVILVVAGLAIVVIGGNLLMAKAAAAANEFLPNVTHVAYHIELPAVVPDWIKNPINTIQGKAETYFANLINLDNMAYLPTLSTEGSPTPGLTGTQEVTITITATPEITETAIVTETEIPVATTEPPIITETPAPVVLETTVPEG